MESEDPPSLPLLLSPGDCDECANISGSTRLVLHASELCRLFARHVAQTDGKPRYNLSFVYFTFHSHQDFSSSGFYLNKVFQMGAFRVLHICQLVGVAPSCRCGARGRTSDDANAVAKCCRLLERAPRSVCGNVVNSILSPVDLQVRSTRLECVKVPMAVFFPSFPNDAACACVQS